MPQAPVAIGATGRTAQTVTTILGPAGTPSARFPVQQSGDYFYLILATAAVFIKPYGGAQNEYVQGTGLQTPDAPFRMVEIENKNAVPVVVSIFVGFGGYIDNRLIAFDPQIRNAVLLTSPLPNVINDILIPDLSAQTFIDSGGITRIALGRVGIYVSNYSLADTYQLCPASDPTGNSGALAIFPQTSIVFPGNGDFHLKVPAGNVNAIVSEIYAAATPS